MKYKDYYAELGVARDADLPQIKKAYRKLARQFHPDVSKLVDAEAKFKDAAEAYATLKDPVKRAAYDQLGRRPAGDEFSVPPQWQRDHAHDGQGFDDVELADLLAELSRRHGGSRREPATQRGRDYETSVHISLEDAYRGTSVKLELAGAEGPRTLEITIPPGVSDGQKLRLRGKGGPGREGGADGDIYLHILFAAHPVFRADQHDLHFDLALAPWEAALGAEVEVPTLDGQVLLTVPAGARAGHRLRLRERGLSNGRGGRGHLYATTRIEVPTALTERERDLFQELARNSRFNPRAGATKENQDASTVK